VAADQVRGAAASAPAQRAIGQRLGDPGIAGQAEVIVAGKIEHLLAVDRAMRPAGASTRRRRVRPAAAMSASSAASWVSRREALMSGKSEMLAPGQAVGFEIGAVECPDVGAAGFQRSDDQRGIGQSIGRSA
jgi:hypothetical protein